MHISVEYVLIEARSGEEIRSFNALSAARDAKIWLETTKGIQTNVEKRIHYREDKE